MHIKITKRKK